MKKNHKRSESKKDRAIIPVKTSSELEEFVERELPTEAKVKKFDSYLKGKLDDTSVAESLSEIYQDDSGQRVNVSQVSIKQRRPFFVRLLLLVLYIAVPALLIGGAYYWIINRLPASSDLELSITAPDRVIANEEFSYIVSYRNRENVALTDVSLQVVMPENFIMTSSLPETADGTTWWVLPDIAALSSGEVTITGRLIARPGESNILTADLSYQPAGITSTFKKTAYRDIVLNASGFDVAVVAPGSALINQDESIAVKITPQDDRFIGDFSMVLTAPDYITAASTDLPAGVTAQGTRTWHIADSTEERQFGITFRASERRDEAAVLLLRFEYADPASGRVLAFEERVVTVEVINNSLNLTISANGRSANQGIGYGEKINYVVSFANRGERMIEDVIIMAVFEGDALDWRGVSDDHNGSVSGQTIVWTKNEIPELRSLARNREGEIVFSIPVRPLHEQPLITQKQIKSYAQFSVGGNPIDLSVDNTASRSNVLEIDLNSDVALDEAVRYFDTDNVPVGTGPLPPRVGETTTVKVYWTVTNSLHELGDLTVSTKLPGYVVWDGKNLAQAGVLLHNPETNTVTWQIGRLPVSVKSLRAEFSVALTPQASDRNKLMILTSGTTLSGTDNQTGHPMSQVLKAQTTQLEKDEIADTDGIVQ